MNLSTELARQFRKVQLNGNWVSTNLKTTLSDITLNESQTKIGTLNTIAQLTFHIHYYIDGILNVLAGGSLDIKDKFSFDLSEFNTESDWNKFVEMTYTTAEQFANQLEQLNDIQLAAPFVDEKYGNYYRNLTAMIEHSYYHLGQIVILKKLIRGDWVKTS